MKILNIIAGTAIGFGSGKIITSFINNEIGYFWFWFSITFVIVILAAGEKTISLGSSKSVVILNYLQYEDYLKNIYVCKSKLNSHDTGIKLIATLTGWICPKCEYKQPYSVAEEKILKNVIKQIS